MPCAVISRCYFDGRFRLTNGTRTVFGDDSIVVMGRIEVCDDSSYRSICYQYWDPIDAQVFCEYYMRANYYRQYQDLTEICKESAAKLAFNYKYIMALNPLQLATQLFLLSMAIVELELQHIM